MVATKTLWTTSVACLSIAFIFSIVAVAVPAWSLQKDTSNADLASCSYDIYNSQGLWGKCKYVKGDYCDDSDCNASSADPNYCDVQCDTYDDDTETGSSSALNKYKGFCKNAREGKIDPYRGWCDKIKAAASFAIISLLAVLVALILTVMARKAEEPGKKGFLAWVLCAATAGTSLMSMSIFSAVVNEGNSEYDIEVDGTKVATVEEPKYAYKVNAGWAMEFLVVVLSAVSFVATFMAARAK